MLKHSIFSTHIIWTVDSILIIGYCVTDRLHGWNEVYIPCEYYFKLKDWEDRRVSVRIT